jgi:hypothetical protein
MRYRLPRPNVNNASLTQIFVKGAKQDNKSFVFKGRGSSVVEQPIRNRQVAGSSPALGSNVFNILVQLLPGIRCTVVAQFEFFVQSVERVYLGFIHGLNVRVLGQPHVAVP